MKAPPKEPAAEYVPIASLKRWKDNPRKNSETIDRVVKLIERFGFGAPILARREDREIIAGHTRIEAAARLGMTDVAVRFMDLSAEDAHQLALADNKAGEFSEWDDDGLAALLAKLNEEDRDLIGFESIDDDPGEPIELTEVDVSAMPAAEFWLQVSGPLHAQPDVLAKLRDALEAIPGVRVSFGSG